MGRTVNSTLHSRINVHGRLFILIKKSTLYAPIWVCTFINSLPKFEILFKKHPFLGNFMHFLPDFIHFCLILCIFGLRMQISIKEKQKIAIKNRPCALIRACTFIKFQKRVSLYAYQSLYVYSGLQSRAQNHQARLDGIVARAADC